MTLSGFSAGEMGDWFVPAKHSLNFVPGRAEVRLMAPRRRDDDKGRPCTFARRTESQPPGGVGVGGL